MNSQSHLCTFIHLDMRANFNNTVFIRQYVVYLSSATSRTFIKSHNLTFLTKSSDVSFFKRLMTKYVLKAY